MDSIIIHCKTFLYDGFLSPKYIYISNSVNIYKYDSYYSSLKEIIIDDSETPLEICDFNGSKQFEKIYLGRNLSYSFYAPPFNITTANIKEIYIGDYVTSIVGLSLPAHKALEKITIGKGLSYVPNLSKHSKLTSLTLNSEVPQEVWESDFSNAQYLYLNVYVPKGSLAAYQSADVWKNFWNLQEMETTDINNVCFSSNDQSVKESKYFDATGREIKSVHKGLNIIKMSDGTTRKVIVK
ncbi:MAG: hypothetical protein K2H97_01755 [Prevotella sp.]|nr:hypothetical protein [Prevotella sp.]